MGVVGVKRQRRKKLVRLTPYPKLLKQADAVFSLWIRKRDGRCVCCGSTENAQAGHLIRRGKHSVRFEESNVNRQCKRCNYLHEFHPQVYTAWYIRKYGAAHYIDLVEMSMKVRKIPRSELEDIIRKYS